jgi:predicted AAA+ superfamily ATPase
MERLLIWSSKNINRVSSKFERYLSKNISWNNRLIILVGSRGVGKTTLMLQYLKKNHHKNEESLYLSLDDIYFTNNSIIDLVDEFSKRGGKYLFLDEIQKYKNWSIEIKNIYDNYPEIQLVLSGSSTIEILKSEGDLSRRALFYKLNGLSFREYLNFNFGYNFKTYSLDEILKNHLQISLEISEKIKPIKEFEEYYKFGYYPFFKEDLQTYHKRIGQILNTVIEVDIPTVYSVDFTAVQNMKKLLGLIAEMVPFKPNVKKLSEQIGISRESLIKYLKYLEKADIIHLLYSENKGITFLNKPEKIYLNNPNISFALSNDVNIGNLRETFFIIQLNFNHKMRFTESGDFLVDDKFTFEIGGKNKTSKQIQNIENSWIVADNIEISAGNKIPLWLFGFIY